MYTIFDIVMIPLQLLIIFFTLYYFFVSWFGLFGKKKEVKIYDESKTFALIACAHNEERVIAQLVDNLRRLNYNDALYDIFVTSLLFYMLSAPRLLKRSYSIRNFIDSILSFYDI